MTEENHTEYERRVAEARTELDAGLEQARAEYRRALAEAKEAGSRQERERKRREARAEYRDAKREHREDYERQCDDADDLLLQAQIITFLDFGPIEFGFTNGLLAATASSGLDVAYTVDTPAICEVSGLAVVGLDLGTCTITASQGGDAVTWAPATDVSMSVEVVDVAPQLPM